MLGIRFALPRFPQRPNEQKTAPDSRGQGPVLVRRAPGPCGTHAGGGFGCAELTAAGFVVTNLNNNNWGRPGAGLMRAVFTARETGPRAVRHPKGWKLFKVPKRDVGLDPTLVVRRHQPSRS